MAKKTKLHGFLKGAKQMEGYLKGETFTTKQYQKEAAALVKLGKKVRRPEVVKAAEDDEWTLKDQKAYDAFAFRAGAARRRKEIGENVVAFKNYGRQIQEYYSGKKKITYEEIKQLAANNRAVRNLDLNGGQYFKYGSASGQAFDKYTKIILDNDYRKLQYLSHFPHKAVEKIDYKKLDSVSLPLTEEGTQLDYDKLKRQINKLSKRLEELDANRHVNSSEFKEMKAAVNALKKTLETPGNQMMKQDGRRLIGEQLETLHAASMNYVETKGVGRQATQLGKDRMELGLDLAEVSADFMNKFASSKRLGEVADFEDSLGVRVTKTTELEDFIESNGFHNSTEANIYENPEKGINEYGKNIEDLEMEDDEDELSDDDGDELD